MKKELPNCIEKQLEIFRKGMPMLKLSGVAKPGNGIMQLTPSDVGKFQRIYTNSTAHVKKFVPSSGAATRMFRDLLMLRDHGKINDATQAFFQNLDKIPFPVRGTNKEEILTDIFNVQQLANLPKGLLPFHKLDKGTRTAAEEHLVEGASYAEKQGKVDLHFTVSSEHLERFEKHLGAVSANYSTEFCISYSTQHPETDTMAVDLNNEPFIDETGNPLFRPAGHGAILENLNQLDSDLIFIKNIDNVVPDRLKEETIKYKKVLAGILLDFQQRVFDLLKRNDNAENISDEAKKLLQELGTQGGGGTKEEVIEKLNRPIRVCGMVRNHGALGGGPFWMKTDEGFETLQIVEAAQIDHHNTEQENIFNQSTHFNPVDLVCGVRNYRGRKFDLIKYRNPNTSFISQKTYKDYPIRVLELPGLWNGSMANWNTLFVEVPLVTFNPVKTVNDLLRPEHQS